MPASAASEAPLNPQFRAEQLQSFLDHCTLFFYRAVASLPAENRDLASRLAAAGHSAQSYREICQQKTVAAIHLALVEEEFAADWPSIARLVPRTDQQWALLAAWIVLGSLPWQGDLAAAFDSLQLRQALAEIFSATGTEGEDIWRAAAKVRTLLLQSDAPEPRVFWSDSDVRWLAGIHESDGVTWVNKEQFEELTDCLQFPRCSKLARGMSHVLETVLEIEAEIDNARETMTEAGYKLDAYLDLRAKQMEDGTDAPQPAPPRAAPGKIKRSRAQQRNPPARGTTIQTAFMKLPRYAGAAVLLCAGLAFAPAAAAAQAACAEEAFRLLHRGGAGQPRARDGGRVLAGCNRD